MHRCAARHVRGFPAPGARRQGTKRAQRSTEAVQGKAREGLWRGPLSDGVSEATSSPPSGRANESWLTTGALGCEVARVVGGVAVDDHFSGISVVYASS